MTTLLNSASVRTSFTKLVRDGFVAMLALALAGCSSSGTALGTWWWPSLDPADVTQTNVDGGRGFNVQGFAVAAETSGIPARSLLGVMLVGSEQEVSCSSYAAYLDTLAETQLWFESVSALRFDDPERPTNAQILGYVCQNILAASREAFGGDGSYRALHLLLDVSGGGPGSGEFRAASKGSAAEALGGAELLGPSTYVGRLYERAVHGADLLPDIAVGSNAGDLDPIASCPAIFNTLLAGSDHLPDAAVPVLNTAAHRYYHDFESQESLPFRLPDNTVIDVVNAVVTPDYGQLGQVGGRLSPTAFLEVEGAVDSFPYEQLLVSTQANAVDVQSCPQLGEALPFVWSELQELGWGVQATTPPGAGDDDDSAGDDDDSA